MGIIIKYQLDFPEVELKVSNDLFSGDFILDADIKVSMNRGTTGGKFEIKLYDLPIKEANKIKEKVGTPSEDNQSSNPLAQVSNLVSSQQSSTLAQVTIKLGYFDDSFKFNDSNKVMEGIVQEVQTEVQGDKLLTTLKGVEVGAYALTNTSWPIKDKNLKGKMKIEEIAKAIISGAKIGKKDIKLEFHGNNIDFSLNNPTFRAEELMSCLDALAQQIDAEFFVLDKSVWLGKPIQNDVIPSLKFDPDVNLATFSVVTKDAKNKRFKDPKSDLLAPIKVEKVEGFRFVITGNPQLRPGQKVSAVIDKSAVNVGLPISLPAGISAEDAFSKIEFRVHSLIHNFSTSTGYTCEGSAIIACTGKDCRSREATFAQPNAEGVAEKITKRAESEQRNRPQIEVGTVQAYTPGNSSTEKQHLSNLYFGQRFEETETQPSIHIGVDSFEQQLFREKPIASPFAWHKCGLVTPIYPGMKALLSHNLGLQDDVIISGFIWSKEPAIAPPKNKEGDWWLCLPIAPDNPPKDNTKAANDLTANNGKRVIEVKGLKITIGEGKLREIGDRPTEGKDDEFLIEHSSGSKILIKDGTIEMTSGGVTLKIGKSSVEIS
jgi:hypothetical protein